MSGGDGSPCKTLLFGAIRDPLKSIGHCKLKVAERNENHVIVGIIVETNYSLLFWLFFFQLQSNIKIF